MNQENVPFRLRVKDAVKAKPSKKCYFKQEKDGEKVFITATDSQKQDNIHTYQAFTDKNEVATIIVETVFEKDATVSIVRDN